MQAGSRLLPAEAEVALQAAPQGLLQPFPGPAEL